MIKKGQDRKDAESQESGTATGGRKKTRGTRRRRILWHPNRRHNSW